MSEMRNGIGEINRFQGVRVVIFDLDGTLIDSKLEIALAVNATLDHMGRPPLDHEVIFSYVGKGAPYLIQAVLGEGATREEAERGLSYFYSYYREHMLDNTVLYPGVREGLDQLQGHSLAVLTNKAVRISEDILAGLDLARYFRYVYGGNSFETKKPDPMGVNILLRDFGASPREAIFVGDSDVDVRTARNAGTWSCGVTYGIGTEGFRENPPDLMLDTLAQLPAHLQGRV